MKSANVEITSKEIIKPSSPTPNSLRGFKFSLLDQLSPLEYTPMILFFETTGDDEAKTIERSNQLRKSLSETLTQFYPLAGRIKDNYYIECNDEGIDFLEAKVNCVLSEILKQPDADLLNQILPCGSISPIEVQLAIQLNIFRCGGIAIGMCALHKIVDASTFCSFINTWASMARASENFASPIFIGASIFPPRDLTGHLPSIDVPKAKCITKRLVFEGSNIDSLRAKVTSISGCDHPTRVQAVSALIWKCAMDASRARLGCSRLSFATHTVNLRARTSPPLPEYSAGNLIWLAIAPAPASGTEIELNALVGQIKNAVTKFDVDHVTKMQGAEGCLVIFEFLKQIGNLISRDIDTYRFTSWCKFPLYDTDFGWGKPVWVSSSGLVFKNVIILMDTKLGNGIEAWVTLDEEDMAIFERNQELRAFVSSVPNA